MNLQELLSKMESHVLKEVEHYRSDYYEYDVPSLEKVKDGKKIWATRESGTHLLSIDRPSTLATLEYYTRNANWYIIEKHGDDYSLTQIKYEKLHDEVKDIVKNIKTYQCEVIDQEGYTKYITEQEYSYSKLVERLVEVWKVKKVNYAYEI